MVDVIENTGESFATAIVILGAAHSGEGVDAEYRYLEKRFGQRGKDWQLVTQALQERDGKHYDILHVQLNEGAIQNIYFDISDFFNKNKGGLGSAPAGQPLTKQQIDAAIQSAMSQMAYGIPDKEIIAKLTAKGFDTQTASVIVQKIRVSQQQKNNDARNQMIIGGLIFFVGLAITIGTYSAASDGGSYVVAWGAIIFGAIRFFRGMSNL